VATVLFLVCGLAWPYTCHASAPVENKSPNIVFIMTDDQSPIPVLAKTCDQSRPFGFNGDPNVHTPVIDSLARNGLVFTRAYVSSSVCSPSRYSILTGRYAGRCEGSRFMNLFPYGEPTRIENNTELEESRENLPRILQKGGYRTGFVGKCHVVDHQLLSAKHRDRVWLGLEYFCYESDDIWTWDDKRLIDFGAGELEKIGIIDSTDVIDGIVIRMPKTYPAYFGTYDEFDKIIDWADDIPNLFMVGRNGMHKYNNQDHSMLTAMTAVDNIMEGRIDKSNIWEVNTEQEYHEEKR